MTNQRRPWITETPDAEVEAALDQLRDLPVALTSLHDRERQGFYTLRYSALAAVYPPAVADGRMIVVTRSYERYVRIVSQLYHERRAEPRRKPTGRVTNGKARKLA